MSDPPIQDHRDSPLSQLAAKSGYRVWPVAGQTETSTKHIVTATEHTPAGTRAKPLTGDHRRDCRVNRLLRACQIREVSELYARAAARMRTATGRADTISAADAIVAAFAETCADPVVLTSDPADLGALTSHAARPHYDRQHITRR